MILYKSLFLSEFILGLIFLEQVYIFKTLVFDNVKSILRYFIYIIKVLIFSLNSFSLASLVYDFYNYYFLS